MAIEIARIVMPPWNEPVSFSIVPMAEGAEEPAEVADRVDQADAPGGGGLGQEQLGSDQKAGR